MNVSSPARILIVDDNAAIHADFRKILTPTDPDMSDMNETAAALFGDEVSAEPADAEYLMDSAMQGEEGLRLVQKSLTDRKPYALAFVDIRMPLGWDGIETISRIWQVDPDTQVVICTAYTDHS